MTRKAAHNNGLVAMYFCKADMVTKLPFSALSFRGFK